MNSIIQESFSINLKVMKIVGLYTPKNYKSLYKVLAYIMYFSFVIVVDFLAVLYIALDKDRDILQLNYSAIYLAETVCFVIKLLPFMKNGKKIKKCIRYFEKPGFIFHRNQEEKIINECNWICKRNSMIYFYGLLIAEISWNVKPLLSKDKFSVDIWLPYEPNTTLKYWSTFLFLAIASIYNGFAGCMVDTLIGGLACQAGGQIKILKISLQYLNKDAAMKNNLTTEEMHEKLRQCVKYQNKILGYFNLYQECFSWVVFSQFASSAFGICFCCLQLRTVPLLSFNGLSSICYTFVLVGQSYFYCYYSAELFEENNSLSDAVYMGEWYTYDNVSKKALIILMERSKQPMIFTAGKVIEVTLNTFKEILKRSYSLIAILQNFQ